MQTDLNNNFPPLSKFFHKSHDEDKVNYPMVNVCLGKQIAYRGRKTKTYKFRALY
jgi:hypothetical protein